MVEVDALRGIAALAVVLFHFSTRYQQVYPGPNVPSLSFAHGHYGVNLFFIISGFVIFMTLSRTRRPLDFVVSRFSRLFPAYWAAVALTFVVVSAFGLPGRELTLNQALANLFMVHNFAGVPHVDAVYWTLEIELLFYATMLALFASGHLHQVHRALWALLALRLLYWVADKSFGVDLSWTLSRLLILKYIPWFALGIVVYEAVASGELPLRGRGVQTAALAILCLAIVDGWGIGVLGLTLSALVWMAAAGRLPWLASPGLAFLGTISYPLYLLHEYIGWVLQRAVQARGGSADLSVILAVGLSIALASMVTFGVERPAMRAMRGWYRRRSSSASV
jgi:peptidoglycan/LPS O-acetylase OafA/YrhL